MLRSDDSNTIRFSNRACIDQWHSVQATRCLTFSDHIQRDRVPDGVAGKRQILGRSVQIPAKR